MGQIEVIFHGPRYMVRMLSKSLKVIDPKDNKLVIPSIERAVWERCYQALEDHIKNHGYYTKTGGMSTSIKELS